MIHTRLVFSSLLLFAASAAAQTPTTIDAESLATAVRLRDKAMTRSEAYIIIESLTTEVGARMAGSPGDALAVAWAERKFRELGYDRVYTEPVTFPIWHRRREAGEILTPFPHKLALTAIGASIGTGAVPLEGTVIEYATLEALKEARAEDVHGKIVFIGNRMQRSRDGSGYGPAVTARTEGAGIAAKLGATALLIRSIGTDGNRTPHTGLGADPEKALLDPERAGKLARTASGIAIVPTAIPAAALSNPDADLLSRVLERSRPVRVRLDLDVGFEGEYTSANVIGEITGSDRPDEAVVIGAHLDSWDLGMGAIDDGAGVALTMAAGYLIKAHGKRPKRSIRVVAFANEEQGLYGGRAYATAHGADVAKIVLGAESDFGAGRVYEIRFGIGVHARDAARQIAEVLAPIGITLREEGGSPGPDLGAIAARGMAWAQLSQDGSAYFDYHHTANDTLDKVNPKDLDQNVAAYAVLAWLAAQADGDFGSAPKSAPAAQ